MTMSDVYVTVAHPATVEFEEKRSLFIGHAIPCTDEETALQFVKEKKKEFADATHNVWAYYMKGGVLARYSDDGEPQGTAGMPTLDAVRKSGACDVCVVVTRYFGGILLGAAGLVRAYSKAAAMAIEAAGIVTYREYTECTVTCDYSLYDKLLYDIGRRTVITDDTEFGSNITLRLAVLSEEYAAFEKALYAMTNGKTVPEKKGTRLDV